MVCWNEAHLFDFFCSFVCSCPILTLRSNSNEFCKFDLGKSASFLLLHFYLFHSNFSVALFVCFLSLYFFPFSFFPVQCLNQRVKCILVWELRYGKIGLVNTLEYCPINKSEKKPYEFQNSEFTHGSANKKPVAICIVCWFCFCLNKHRDLCNTYTHSEWRHTHCL